MLCVNKKSIKLSYDNDDSKKKGLTRLINLSLTISWYGIWNVFSGHNFLPIILTDEFSEGWNLNILFVRW